MKKIEKLIDEFNSDEITKELKTKLETKSFMDIFSISRRENSHSSFIQWLLDYNNNSTLKAFPLKEFLKLLFSYNVPTIIKELKDCLFNNLSSGDLKISVEFSELKIERKAGKGRIDILLKFFIKYKTNKGIEKIDYVNILIENKVDSIEYDSQTLKYEKYKVEVPFELKNKIIKKDIITLFVYLSPSKEEKYKPKSDKFIHITYQELLDKVIQPSYDILKDNDEKVKFYLSEYINNLGFSNKKIMALSKIEKKKLENFWIKNNDLIKLVLEYISKNKKLFKNEKLKEFWIKNEELIVLVVEARLKNQDLSEGEIKIANDIKNKIELTNATDNKKVQLSLKRLIEENLIRKGETIKLTQKDYSKETFGVNYAILKEVENANKVDKYWLGLVESNGKNYVICSEWYEKMRVKFKKWEENLK